MGLETVHPEALARLNKRLSLDEFARAAARLRARPGRLARLRARGRALRAAGGRRLLGRALGSPRSRRRCGRGRAHPGARRKRRAGAPPGVWRVPAPDPPEPRGGVRRGPAAAEGSRDRGPLGRLSPARLRGLPDVAPRATRADEPDGPDRGGRRLRLLRGKRGSFLKTTRTQVVIVGSGFAGSLLARLLARQGLSVTLLERGSHPRFAIGESSTPLASLCLERLSDRYGQPDLRHLAAHGRWIEHLPGLRRGLKRGFSFYRHRPGRPYANDEANAARLLVAASPTDRVADTHWLREDVDHHLVRQAVAAGVDYRDQTEVTAVAISSRGVRLATSRSGRSGRGPGRLHRGCHGARRSPASSPADPVAARPDEDALPSSLRPLLGRAPLRRRGSRGGGGPAHGTVSRGLGGGASRARRGLDVRASVRPRRGQRRPAGHRRRRPAPRADRSGATLLRAGGGCSPAIRPSQAQLGDARAPVSRALCRPRATPARPGGGDAVGHASAHVRVRGSAVLHRHRLEPARGGASRRGPRARGRRVLWSGKGEGSASATRRC